MESQRSLANWVRPVYRERFLALFRDVLRCDVRELDFGMALPIALVAFQDGSAFTVEFDERAVDAERAVDDASAFRGAWLEFRAADASYVKNALLAAGIPSFAHSGSPHDYFVAPGGKVFRILALDCAGP